MASNIFREIPSGRLGSGGVFLNQNSNGISQLIANEFWEVSTTNILSYSGSGNLLFS
jgi:hypothetical protein